MSSSSSVSSWLLDSDTTRPRCESDFSRITFEADIKEDIMIDTYPLNLSEAEDQDQETSIPKLSNFQDQEIQRELKFYRARTTLFSRIMIILFSLNLILSVLLGVAVKSKSNPTFLQDYLVNSFNHHSNDFMKFRKQLLTQNRVEILNKDHHVLPIHSHNDYWRKTPLFDALRLGINSVEADVWYLPSTKDSQSNPPELYVGHKRFSLSSYRTLKSLYLSNLEALLDDVNSKIDQVGTQDSEHKQHGIFYDDPEKILYLVVDFKTDPDNTLKVLQSQLAPFIEKNYLTYYNTTSSQFYHGPITIVVSGNIPYELINQQVIRYTFIDAPLHDTKFANLFNSTTSIFSSSSLKKLTGSKSTSGFNGLSEDQKTKLSEKIQIAHDLGIKVRVWDTPKWPVSVRNAVWRDLLKLGVDLLNVDDLQGAVTF